jgi:hypothetical protein
LQEVEKMIFEAAFCLSFAAVARILRAYKRRQDVLYGPYVRQNDWNARAIRVHISGDILRDHHHVCEIPL